MLGRVAIDVAIPVDPAAEAGALIGPTILVEHGRRAERLAGRRPLLRVEEWIHVEPAVGERETHELFERRAGAQDARQDRAHARVHLRLGDAGLLEPRDVLSLDLAADDGEMLG